MIREALEFLTRPLRRRRWERRRARIIEAHERWDRRQGQASARFNPLEQDHVCVFPPQPIPEPWSARDPADIKQDIHRLIDRARKEWKRKRTICVSPLSGAAVDVDLEREVDEIDPERVGEREVVDYLKRTRSDLQKKKIDARYNPLADDCCILLPCSKCSSMTCADPEAHFGVTYEQLMEISDDLGGGEE